MVPRVKRDATVEGGEPQAHGQGEVEQLVITQEIKQCPNSKAVLLLLSWWLSS